MNKDDLTKALGELSEEERRGLLEHEQGWSHPGRKIQRVIAGLLFLTGTFWAVILILSLFVLVGIFPNVIFIFGWLIYGGWFFVMMGKRMSVSLRFFWTASIVVHLGYGFLFASSKFTEAPAGGSWEGLLSTGLAWWIPAGLSVVALGCEVWAVTQRKDGGMLQPEDEVD